MAGTEPVSQPPTNGDSASPLDALSNGATQLLCCAPKGRGQTGSASTVTLAGASKMEPVEEGPLMKGFYEALAAKEDSEMAVKFVDEHRNHVANVLNLFSADGRLIGRPTPASCFNDLYKWTMFPVVNTVEKAFGSDVRCTFSVNIRDEGYRKQLLDSANGSFMSSPKLYNDMKDALREMTKRPFDRSTFERCAADYQIPGWGPEVLDAVCGTEAEPRMLIQEFAADVGPSKPSAAGNVLLDIFVAHDEKLNADRVYIEATGPWHRVTWLETSMMQTVYDVLLRDRKRSQYGEEDAVWYPKWLAESFCRCARSTAAAVESGLAGALFTGRRTGGLSLMMIQGMYVQQHFKNADGKSMMLGSSSVTACYMSLDAGVPKDLVPKAAGTHAHELSMVIGAILGEVDDKAGMPVSQIVGHMLYFYKSRPQGDVQDVARKPLMPMLPDTLGSKAFMKAASRLTVPQGPHQGQSILSIIGAARQDSGGLDSFKELMDEFEFKGDLMASEIETADDLFLARDNGYKLFGAGGFMGDSEKAWDKTRTNISMACKVLRVYVNGEQVPSAHTPVKTGECGDEGKIKEGKFEGDGLLKPEELKALRARAQILANAEPKLDNEALQKLFVETLGKFDLCAESGSSCAIS